jgi:hypothetical protein
MNGDLINVSIIKFLDYNHLANRAMKFFFIIIIIFMQISCTTIEVAKEVSRASNSVKKSVSNIINSIEKDKENLSDEKKKEKKLVIEQKKNLKIDFINKQIGDFIVKIGDPDLSRVDGDTQIIRYDNKNCRLFLIFNKNDKLKKIKYYEIRDKKGNLITKKNDVQKCYRNFKLS